MKTKVRKIAKSEYAAAKSLWAECFPEDDGEFIDYYFAHRTSHDNIICAFDGDGRMLSGLHIIEQTLRICGTEKRIGFIAGVGTKPEYRNRGIASKLLEASVPIMRQRGLTASVLQPFNADFYKKYGYRDFVFCGRCKPVEPSRCESEAYDARSLLLAYNTLMAEYDGYVVRDEAAYTKLIGEFSAANTRIFSHGDSYAFAYIEDAGKTAQVIEFVGNDDAATVASMIKGVCVDAEIPVPADSPLCEAGSVSVFNQLLPIDEHKLTEGTDFSSADGLIRYVNRHGYALDRY